MNDCSTGYNLDAPDFIWPGFGYLILRNLRVDRLTLDGVPMCDEPELAGLHHQGFFNVPPGSHVLIAEYGEQHSEVTVDVPANDAAVCRLDWEAGGWKDDPEREGLREFARSAVGVHDKSLRAWPFATAFLSGVRAGEVIEVDGRPIVATGPFLAVSNLAPGEHHFGIGAYLAGCHLPLFGAQCIAISADEPEFLNGEAIAKTVRPQLLKARLDAVVRGDLPASPEAELAEVKRAFAAHCSAPNAESLSRVGATLRKNAVSATEMATRAEFFGGYADLVIGFVAMRPDLALAPDLRKYVDYLRADLVDTDHESLVERGLRLRATVERIEFPRTALAWKGALSSVAVLALLIGLGAWSRC